MRIALLGRDGQLGRDLAGVLPAFGEVIPLGRGELDLTHTEQIEAVLDRIMPDLIVNAAAYTAVDRAESEPTIALAVNGEAPGAIARWTEGHAAALIHFSTDYVFDGRKDSPYAEDDDPHPLSVYGKTKLEGERAIAASGAAHLILRTSWVYSAHGSNFFNTMLRLAREREALAIVDDQLGAPTPTGDLGRAVAEILGAALGRGEALCDAFRARGGIFHASNRGATSWYRFAQRIFELIADDERRLQQLRPIPTAEYPTPAVRPANSCLDNTRLARLWGVALPSWEEGLARVAEARRLLPSGN